MAQTAETPGRGAGVGRANNNVNAHIFIMPELAEKANPFVNHKRYMIMEYDEFIQDKTDVTKFWLQQVLLNSRKSVAIIAEAMGFKSESSLYKATNPSENHRLHLENLPILIHETGDFSILDEIEALLGRVAWTWQPLSLKDAKTATWDHTFVAE